MVSFPRFEYEYVWEDIESVEQLKYIDSFHLRVSLISICGMVLFKYQDFMEIDKAERSLLG